MAKVPSGGRIALHLRDRASAISSGVICGRAPPAAGTTGPPAAGRGPPGPPGPPGPRPGPPLIITIGFGSWYCTISGRCVRLIDEQAQRAAGLFLGFENVGLAVGRFGDAGIDPRCARIREQRRRQRAAAARACGARALRSSAPVVGAGPPPGPGPSPGPRITICMPPPMPPRLAMSSHAVVAGQHRRALDRRTADHAAHLHLFNPLHLVGTRQSSRVDSAFHVAAAHRAAERTFRGQALETGDLVFTAERLPRRRNTLATRSCAASGRIEMPSM